MLTFDPLMVPPSRKTRQWSVSCRGALLGRVSWYAQWRRYCFWPNVSTNILFDPSCLREIADFCEAQTKEHKA